LRHHLFNRYISVAIAVEDFEQLWRVLQFLCAQHLIPIGIECLCNLIWWRAFHPTARPWPTTWHAALRFTILLSGKTATRPTALSSLEALSTARRLSQCEAAAGNDCGKCEECGAFHFRFP
jgi:hypothetical protein